MTTEEMITELRLTHKQIIHGTSFFGDVANRLEALHITDQFEAELEEKNKAIATLKERLAIVEADLTEQYARVAAAKSELETLKDFIRKSPLEQRTLREEREVDRTEHPPDCDCPKCEWKGTP